MSFKSVLKIASLIVLVTFFTTSTTAYSDAEGVRIVLNRQHSFVRDLRLVNIGGPDYVRAQLGQVKILPPLRPVMRESPKKVKAPTPPVEHSRSELRNALSFAAFFITVGMATAYISIHLRSKPFVQWSKLHWYTSISLLFINFLGHLGIIFYRTWIPMYPEWHLPRISFLNWLVDFNASFWFMEWLGLISVRKNDTIQIFKKRIFEITMFMTAAFSAAEIFVPVFVRQMHQHFPSLDAHWNAIPGQHFDWADLFAYWAAGGLFYASHYVLTHGFSRFRSELRSRKRAETIDQLDFDLEDLFRKAGIKRAEELQWNEKGPHLSSVSFINSEFFSSLPIQKGQPTVLIDAGHGQGEMAILLAHQFPSLKIIGIEFDEDLFRDSEALLRTAEEELFVGPGQVEFYHGDFNDARFLTQFELADYVYYADAGTHDLPQFFQTLARRLKPGARIINLGLSQSLNDLLTDSGMFFLESETGRTFRVRIFKRAELRNNETIQRNFSDSPQREAMRAELRHQPNANDDERANVPYQQFISERRAISDELERMRESFVHAQEARLDHLRQFGLGLDFLFLKDAEETAEFIYPRLGSFDQNMILAILSAFPNTRFYIAPEASLDGHHRTLRLYVAENSIKSGFRSRDDWPMIVNSNDFSATSSERMSTNMVTAGRVTALLSLVTLSLLIHPIVGIVSSVLFYFLGKQAYLKFASFAKMYFYAVEFGSSISIEEVYKMASRSELRGTKRIALPDLPEDSKYDDFKTIRRAFFNQVRDQIQTTHRDRKEIIPAYKKRQTKKWLLYGLLNFSIGAAVGLFYYETATGPDLRVLIFTVLIGAVQFLGGWVIFSLHIWGEFRRALEWEIRYSSRAVEKPEIPLVRMGVVKRYEIKPGQSGSVIATQILRMTLETSWAGFYAVVKRLYSARSEYWFGGKQKNGEGEWVYPIDHWRVTEDQFGEYYEQLRSYEVAEPAPAEISIPNNSENVIRLDFDEDGRLRIQNQSGETLVLEVIENDDTNDSIHIPKKRTPTFRLVPTRSELRSNEEKPELSFGLRTLRIFGATFLTAVGQLIMLWLLPGVRKSSLITQGAKPIYSALGIVLTVGILVGAWRFMSWLVNALASRRRDNNFYGKSTRHISNQEFYLDMLSLKLFDPAGEVPGRIRYSQMFTPEKIEADLSIVPHGMTDANAQGRMQGNHDANDYTLLNEEGKKQAQEGAIILFAQLEEKLKRGEKIHFLVSPLARAMQTAQYFVDYAKTKGYEIKLIPDLDAMEMDFGNAWGGLTLTPEQQALKARYLSGDALVRPPNGETYLEFLMKVKQFIRKVNHVYGGSTVVVFGHRTFATALKVLTNPAPKYDEFIQWTKLVPNDVRGKPIQISTQNSANRSELRDSTREEFNRVVEQEKRRLRGASNEFEAGQILEAAVATIARLAGESPELNSLVEPARLSFNGVHNATVRALSRSELRRINQNHSDSIKRAHEPLEYRDLRIVLRAGKRILQTLVNRNQFAIQDYLNDRSASGEANQTNVNQSQTIAILPNLAQLPDLIYLISQAVQSKDQLVVLSETKFQADQIKFLIPKELIDSKKVIIADVPKLRDRMKRNPNSRLVAFGIPEDQGFADQMERLLSGIDLETKIASVERIETMLGISGLAEQMRLEMRARWAQAVAA